MRVTIIGCGYAGLATSVALACIGHRVHCVDQNQDYIESLQNGNIPIYESGVKELLLQIGERLSFGGWVSFDSHADVIMITVGTPRKENGDADLTSVEAVARELGQRLTGDRFPVIVNKSTVPIGSARLVESIISNGLRKREICKPVVVASNPEFLREGAALSDTFYPDRIVIGIKDGAAFNILRDMYAPILEQTFTPPEFLSRPDGFTRPILVTTTPVNAELIKYAANAFLAMKISYINEIACLAEKIGADIKEVARGIGLDKRIGPQYLEAGIGWGGSCFGKDLRALIHTAGQYAYEMPLCSAAALVNKRMREEVIKKLQAALKFLRGSTIGLLGLSFKPGTDDLRNAPSITIAGRLIELGAHVKVYDPVAMGNCARVYPELDVEYAAGVKELARGADALVLVTEWREFIGLPFASLGELMSQKIIIDGRNFLNARELVALGFNYTGIGR